MLEFFIFQPVGNFSYITVSHKHETVMVKTKDITNILMEEIFVYILLRKVLNKKKSHVGFPSIFVAVICLNPLTPSEKIRHGVRSFVNTGIVINKINYS